MSAAHQGDGHRRGHSWSRREPGCWAGQTGMIKLPIAAQTAMIDVAQPKAAGPIIYYRDPNGKPFYSLTPKRHRRRAALRGCPRQRGCELRLREGQSRRPSRRPQRSSTTAIPWASPTSRRCPRRTRWGWTTSRSTRARTATTTRSRSLRARSSALACKTEPVGKHAITRTIQAPGVVALDERRVTVVAPRFDGFIDKVGAGTSGTHVKKGDVLMTVFGQELLNQAARLLVERTRAGPRR